MEFSESLKKNRDFKTVYGNGKSRANKYLVMYVMKNGTEKNRIGISVSKKLGNAVFRNKYKRQLRFIIDKNKKYYQNGVDYIIIIRNGYVNLDFADKEKKYVNLIEKVNSYYKKEILNEEKK